MIETMQKRINKIKQQDRKSYYEIANEIGISESTLYRLISRGELFEPAKNKITSYLTSYLTKDEKLEAYRLDNEELKAENERLREENEILKQSSKTLAEGVCKQNELAIKYKQALAEIKEIAGKQYEPFDYSQIKSATEIEYDYIARGQECYLRLQQILQKISEVVG